MNADFFACFARCPLDGAAAAHGTSLRDYTGNPFDYRPTAHAHRSSCRDTHVQRAVYGQKFIDPPDRSVGKRASERHGNIEKLRVKRDSVSKARLARRRRRREAAYTRWRFAEPGPDARCMRIVSNAGRRSIQSCV